jgi:hypothetical protein
MPNYFPAILTGAPILIVGLIALIMEIIEGRDVG